MELKVGKWVYHDKLGLGLISQIFEEKIVQINFDGVEKRLMIRFAKFTEPTKEQLQSKTVNEDLQVDYIDKDGVESSLNASEITELESFFGHELPSNYSRYLMNFPKEVSNFKREFSIAKELLTERYLRNKISDIIQVNKDFEVFRLENLIAIGDDGCGNYYAIKSNGFDSNVYFIDHEGYLDKTLNKFVALTNENFSQLVQIVSLSMEAYGAKIVDDSIKFHKRQ